MKKPPQGAKGAKPAGIIPGGTMKGAPRPAGIIPGGTMKAAPAPAKKAAPAPAKVVPGNPMRRPAPHKKPAAHKKTKPRKLAPPGQNCVTTACHALTGHWLVAGDDGLLIPDALEALALLGLIAGFDAADLDDGAPGLILGLDLPGPHAVLTVPGGWWSWGERCDPAEFPAAVIEEAWEAW